jgi:mono/diheme cytochrome c family protein
MDSSVVDKSVPKSELMSLAQQLLLLIVGLVAAVGLTWAGVRLGIDYWQMQDPYVQQVVAVPGNGERGQAIFMINCSGCHGLEANGRVGPSLRGIGGRKSKLKLIQQVVSGQTPPMPRFQPSPQEMADLLTYLESL